MWIASGPILSIPIHSHTCQYDPCKVLLKKMTLSLPMNLPKSVFFGSSDWANDWLVTDPVLALVPKKYLYLRLPTPINCIPHPYWMYTKCFSTLRCYGWAYRCILMLEYMCRWGWILGKRGMAEPVWCYGVMVEAENPHRMHPTSILDVYKVFLHLEMLWMGIWVHPYSHNTCAGGGEN